MLRVGSLTVELDRRAVVRDVSLTVAAGEWLALIGPNGAGKSTLLRAIAGLVRGREARGAVTAGELRLHHASRREWSRTIAFVPQDPLIPAGMTVRDYVLLGRTPHLPFFGDAGPRDREVVDAVIDRLDLRRFVGRWISELSGGERQLALLARALVQQAPVLLLDEPTTALDLGHQQHVLDVIDVLRRERALVVVTALHDLTVAAHYADRLALLHDGELVAQGASSDVLTEATVLERFGAFVRVVDGGDGLVIVPVKPRRVEGAVAPTPR